MKKWEPEAALDSLSPAISIFERNDRADLERILPFCRRFKKRSQKGLESPQIG